MKTESLALSSIRLDGGTQCRASLDQDHIATLADAWQDGAKMPAVVVFHDGSNYWLADGFHRYHAAQKCEFRDIEAEVRSGTRCDAVKFALGANAAHGLRRTNADKRRAVEIALKEFPKLSNVELARICAVNDKTVAAARADMVGRSEIPNAATRTDSAGRQQPATKPARPVVEQPSAEPGKPELREVVVPFVVPPQRSQAESAQHARRPARQETEAEFRRRFAFGVESLMKAIPEQFKGVAIGMIKSAVAQLES